MQQDVPPTPLAAEIDAWFRERLWETKWPVLFVSGAQGIGKSSALRWMETKLMASATVLSIDDFYLPAAAREKLARDVHPLCATRGPAGTHDLPLLMQVIDHIVDGTGPDPVPVPVFDKARDDRLPESAWRTVPVGPPLIIEGWLMGAESDWRSPSAPPINAVEAEDDKGIWRAWQEANLAKGYAALWDRADAFLHIDAPSFEIVRAWRIQQEETTLGLAPGTLPPERVAWVERFIQHYERVTRRMLQADRRPGVSIRVDENRVPSPF